MPYKRQWETLGEALQRLRAAGQCEADAKRELCEAISDRAIPTRYVWDDGEELGGEDLIVPARLEPADLCWSASRPVKNWKRQETVADYYLENGVTLKGGRLQLCCEEVTRVLLHTIARQDVPLTNAKPGLMQAAATIKGQTRWQQWLELQMKVSPEEPRSKATMREEGKAAGLPKVSDRGFQVAWAEAVKDAQATAWRSPGRRRSGGCTNHDRDFIGGAAISKKA